MAMLLLKRLRDLIVILFVVGTMMFFIVRSIPGDPAESMLGPHATPEQLSRMREALGLGGSLWDQYAHWGLNVLHGNLGVSITSGQPVLSLVVGRLLPTVTLAVLSTVVSFIVSTAIVTFTAVRPANPVARVLNRLASLGIAIPDFWAALILVLVFSTLLRWLPPGGYANLFTAPQVAIPHLVLPVAVLVIGQSAMFSMVLGEGVISELNSTYLRTARMKGLGELRIVLTHVLPNAILPLLTVAGTNFAMLLGGVVIIENIFVMPGVGNLAQNAILTRDFPLIQGVTLFLALVFVVVNAAVDILYGRLDPKVRVS